jgi:hypothetical protein
MFQRIEMRSYLILLLLTFSSFCYANKNIGPIISFQELIPNKAKYNENTVTLYGVVMAAELHIGASELQRKVYLFPSTESARYFLNHESIELKLKFDSIEKFHKFRADNNLKMFKVTGNFNASNEYNGQPIGVINKVTNLKKVTKNRFVVN